VARMRVRGQVGKVGLDVGVNREHTINRQSLEGCGDGFGIAQANDSLVDLGLIVAQTPVDVVLSVDDHIKSHLAHLTRNPHPGHNEA